MQGTTGLHQAAARQAAMGEAPLEPAADTPAAAVAVDDEPEQMQPIVRSEWEKTPRNAPCPCGSGKKFKLCHGR